MEGDDLMGYGLLESYPSTEIHGNDAVGLSTKALALIWKGSLNVTKPQVSAIPWAEKQFKGRGDHKLHCRDVRGTGQPHLKDSGGPCCVLLSCQAQGTFLIPNLLPVNPRHKFIHL